MKRTLGLRAQLVASLALILVVATLSVGMIAAWATGRQLDEVQRRGAAALGVALAAALEPTLEQPGLLEQRARPLASVLSHWFGEQGGGPTLELYGPRLRRRVGFGADGGPVAFVRQAMLEAQQVTEVVAGPRLEVDTPIGSRAARPLGVVRLQLPLAAQTARWPLLFWLLMALDSLVLVLFVGLVLTRYVVRPVEAMQRAAALVSAGELGVTLDEDQGGRELSSLARSFNLMTASVKDQLGRIESQRQSLIRSEKLASVGRLAAGVAHEIGNPMQSIIGFTDLLRDSDLDESTRRDYLARIQSEAERIHQTLRDLLSYSRPSAGAIEPVALGEVVTQALALVAPQQRFKGVEARVDHAALARLAPAAASGQQLVQVLVNLLLNAADAMPGNGQVRIGAAAVGPAEVGIEISNDGPAVPDEHRELIFDPFFSTKDPGQGAGLGLSVSRSIVETFNGQLTLLDHEGRTTFAIALPKYPEL